MHWISLELLCLPLAFMKFLSTNLLCMARYSLLLFTVWFSCFGFCGLGISKKLVQKKKLNTMNKYLKFILIFLLFILLAVIRFFEDEIFNDPLIEFYHSTYKFTEAPSFDLWQLIMTTSFRFLLNTIISLLIIWIAFPSKKTLKFW